MTIKSLIKKFHPTLYQLIRYGIVGVSGAIVYFFANVGSVELLSLAPWQANIIAATLSTITCYIGHHYFTFRCCGNHKSYFPKFITQAVIIFMISQTVVIIGEALHAHYIIAVTINLITTVVILPFFGFLSFKLLVFKK